MNRRLIALTLLTAAVVGWGNTTRSTAAPAVSPATPRIERPAATPPSALSLGSEGDQVEALQSRFDRWGYTIAVDGEFGPQTDSVVRSWQRSNGITVDGIVGPETSGTFDVADALTGNSTPAASTTATRNPPVADPPLTVEQMIRDVWPDELEERALVIAYRESRYVPTAHNYCCHGLFQIYFRVHRGWLADYGVTSIDQLYDPMTNVRMAYVLYQRAGGWGPWKQTDPG